VADDPVTLGTRVAKSVQVDKNASSVHTEEAGDGAMGASDLTTDMPVSGNGEVVDDDAPAVANGQVAKKRKKQKARAAVAANGHNGKGAEQPSKSNGNGNGHRPDATNGAVVTEGAPPELPSFDDVEEPLADDTLEPEFDAEAEAVAAEEPPVRRSRRAARKAKKAEADTPEAEEAELGATEDAEAEVETTWDGPAEIGKVGRRAARKARRQPVTPAVRRAQLVATSASIAAAVAEAQAADAPKPRRLGKWARRLFALVAILMFPAAVSALVVTDAEVTPMSHADATYMSKQLITADQRVRRQLVRLRPMHTAGALGRTRDATAMATAFALEISHKGGPDAAHLQRALKLEGIWLDAVGSVLSNPRSPLRSQLAARNAPLVPALALLASPPGHRKGGSQALVRYAKARIADTRKGKRHR
jgi:hypothetical protein